MVMFARHLHRALAVAVGLWLATSIAAAQERTAPAAAGFKAALQAATPWHPDAAAASSDWAFIGCAALPVSKAPPPSDIRQSTAPARQSTVATLPPVRDRASD